MGPTWVQFGHNALILPIWDPFAHACWECTRLTVRIKLIRQLYKLGNRFGKFKKDSNHMILNIRVRKSYILFQISDFYTYCSVIYVIYNHNIINMYMYVLSYHLSIKIILGVSITILSMKKKNLMHIL